MTSSPTPDEIRRASFRTAFRGLDPGEVEAFLDRVAGSLAELEAHRDRLATRLGEFAERDLRSEFETVGREVASVLESARQAAETMRDRASADAARWRSEAVAEAETLRKEARSDAEALRTDAWTAGTQLIEQALAEAERAAAVAEKDSLSVRGEAEREAHRLVAAARREAEDLIRNARMEAEKLTADARAEHDEVISNAYRQAEAAQERTRALEQRRQELMAELDSVRETLSSFEDELEDRRAGIGLLEPTEIPRRMVVADEKGGEPHVKDWEEGHTVRVIHPSRPESILPGSDEDTSTPTADDLADEVARLHRTRSQQPPEVADAGEQPPIPDAPESATAPATRDEPESASTPGEDPRAAGLLPGIGPVSEAEPSLSTEAPAEPADDHEEVPADDTARPAAHEAEEEPPSVRPVAVEDLFRSLRRPQAATETPASVEKEAAGAPTPSPPAADDEAAGAAFERRERLLLPITNAALRAVKRLLTDAQNEALDQIRVSEGTWTPDEGLLGDALSEGIDTLVNEAIAAGLAAAGEVGVDADVDAAGVPRPEPTDLAGELTVALAGAVTQAGSGPRERSAAASRIFRGWRSDQAERRVRFVALTGYHGGLKQGLEGGGRGWRWVANGRMCPQCRVAAEARDVVPPAHRDCDCTIVPV